MTPQEFHHRLMQAAPEGQYVSGSVRVGGSHSGKAIHTHTIYTAQCGKIHLSSKSAGDVIRRFKEALERQGSATNEAAPAI